MNIIADEVSAFLSRQPDTEHSNDCLGTENRQHEKYPVIRGTFLSLTEISPKLISSYLTRNTALAINLWWAVDTTANEKSLNRRSTIDTNACTQEKIIEFLSILHYNESLDISTDRARRTLQRTDNYLVGEWIYGPVRQREGELHYTGGWGGHSGGGSIWCFKPHIYLLSGFLCRAHSPINSSLSLRGINANSSFNV